MEVTGSLVVQVIVADSPTVRGLSRPVIILLPPDVDFKRERERRQRDRGKIERKIDPHVISEQNNDIEPHQ